jgi:hypothetical protein
VAVCAGGLFLALSIGALQGILINVLPARAFRRVSPWVQMTLMGVLALLFFLTPATYFALRRLFEANSPLLRLFPPFWFVAWYVDMLPGRPAGEMFRDLALLAKSALAVSAGVFALTYLAGYARHARRVMESLETASDGPGRLRRRRDAFWNEHWLKNPLERATFHFISNTILRTAKNRLMLAAYAGCGLALALITVVSVKDGAGGPLLAVDSAIFVVVPLTLSFFAVAGLRSVFNYPAELRANWIFQMCESADRAAHLRAVRKWMAAFGIAPLFAALAPFEITLRGWRVGMIHLSFALLLSMVLLNLLLVWFRKIPFTCAYFPGKSNLAASAVFYAAGFSAYCWSMAALVERLIRTPVALAMAYILLFAILGGLAWFGKRELQADGPLVYEDRPDPIVQTLDLG